MQVEPHTTGQFVVHNLILITISISTSQSNSEPDPDHKRHTYPRFRLASQNAIMPPPASTESTAQKPQVPRVNFGYKHRPLSQFTMISPYRPCPSLINTRNAFAVDPGSKTCGGGLTEPPSLPKYVGGRQVGWHVRVRQGMCTDVGHIFPSRHSRSFVMSFR